MTDDNILSPMSNLSPPTSEPKEPLNNDDKVRWFLVRWTILFMLLALGAYLITRDVAILLGSTVVGIAVLFVFSYYFSQKK